MSFVSADARLSLASLVRTGQTTIPPRVMIYGPHKIGKSTFGADAPKPVFIDIEGGLNAIDTQAWKAESFQDVLGILGTLYSEDHDFKTLVVDSVDWLETLIWKHVVELKNEPKIKSIEDFGYGKGYVEALTHWRTFLSGITALRDHKGMATILLAHAQIKRFDAPDKAQSYDRYQPKLHASASALTQEAVDVIGFATFDATVIESDVGFKNTKSRAIGSGRRLLHLEERPAYLAGSRYRMPPTIGFSWGEFSLAFAEACKAPAAEGAPF
jgi:hypothetical protein